MASQRWTADDVRRVTQQHQQAVAKPSKYKNQKTVVDGYTFDSKKEAARFNELKLLTKAGQCRDLEVQPVYPIRVNDVLVAQYSADFRWVDVKTGLQVIEDVKSAASKTTVYELKKKLVEAIYGIQIRET